MKITKKNVKQLLLHCTKSYLSVVGDGPLGGHPCCTLPVQTRLQQSAKLTELALRSRFDGTKNSSYNIAPASLKERCIRRVLELGLSQDCLPLTLREEMGGGPEPRKLRAEGQRMLEKFIMMDQHFKLIIF